MDLKVTISDRDHARGGTHAAVTLVEYGDFDCPYCAKAFPEVRALLGRFPTNVRFVFRHNPRGELHPHARIAAEAAEAAALQGKFWQMHDKMFEHAKDLSEPALLRYAAEIGLDAAKFAKDLHAPEIAERVRQDEVGGLKSGVVGTPTFFLNGTHYRDKPDFASMASAIEEELAKTPSRTGADHGIRRRDATGHLDPAYEAELRAKSGRGDSNGDRAFLGRARSADALSEQLGEEFVETATTGQDEGEEVFNQVVPEEAGGPFVETDGRTEFAQGTDESNIKGATREPFPKT